MILVLGSDRRKIDHDLDSRLIQDILRSDSTPLEDHGRPERSRRQDDHLPRLHNADLPNRRRLLGIVRDLGERVVAVLDSGCLGPVERDAERLLLAEEVEVRLRFEDRVDEAVCGILPASRRGRDPLGPGGDCGKGSVRVGGGERGPTAVAGGEVLDVVLEGNVVAFGGGGDELLSDLRLVAAEDSSKD